MRTYSIRTYGCQMNVHDSERLAGLLEDAGYVRAPSASGDDVDLVVFNTCAVRENADNRLYGNLGRLYPAKQHRPGMQIAVGGCLAQKDRGTIVDRAPWVDVVFGTHNLAALPVLLERARHNAEAQVEIVEALQNFPSDLPSRRESPYSAWVSVSVGCDNSCTFCIVPSLRGAETDRRPGDVLAEIRALVESGVVEVTLLGQNVNSYGRSFGDQLAFGKLLRACGSVDGLERVRFTSPHPRDFTDDVIAAMAETPNVMPALHMPLQSGSDAMLRAMRRSYRQSRYLEIISRVRAAMPDAAITTDIIVGFPGETDDDFEQTLSVVREARFASAFTFQYSKRPGTPAATMDDQVPKPVVQERYERLIELQDGIAWDANRALVGREVEVLVSRGEGRKDGATGRVSGRARDGRLVHVAIGDATVTPGDTITATVTYAAPHHLVADSGITSHRPWRGTTEIAHQPT
ncbi:MAG TPA: tRNA (N6-isopentenyl adenosine(37)-C2)-methylthiotransferase MiaB, partial [Jatrophihabitantaceae bacterium]|nr:tRNA (N6-isopentenyl adenosine(37)-C2)-methylthiotransferase MiaB [Jatrophihabitantaceae bacterium]